ncbi:related to Phosphatidylinositol transfer protein sfh5 [Rhynchosporium graminicola]|uniref:Phosphatidylinositol transfer protein SFH5 n=1 Tax=Rhynchosporium graminicola TaxID=2792576 RepID=A0A1E1KVG4_9HELO|nr:related to Phosphatidylinositol transfer protein sfh5 [Rhynchosporium commune]
MSFVPEASVPATNPQLSTSEEKKLEACEATLTATQGGPATVVAPAPASGVDPKTSHTDAADEKKINADADADAEDKTATTAEEQKPVATPQEQLLAELPSIIQEASHNEIWGVTLKDRSHVPTTIVLEKFLRANTKNVAKAKSQLIEALKWRKKMDPAKLLDEVEFDRSKFGGLGFVTVYPKTETPGKEIVTWNIYGAVKDNKKTFGDVEEFIKWRASLMELSVRELDLASATEPIPADGIDPYRMVQVHDYLNTSFIRMDPAIKVASKTTIDTFSMAYPELLKEKFFVNIPLVMGWVFSAMKLFLSPETVKKFHPLSYGSSLAGELKGWGSELPVAYGGKGKDVKEGLTVRYADEVAKVEAKE